MAPKTCVFVGALAVCLPLDQLTKMWIIDRFHYGERFIVVPGFFDLTHVRNPGGAFSLLANGPSEWRLAFFITTTLIAVALLLVFFRRLEPDARLSGLALGSILGGALGNLIDRIRHGEVIDFIDVHLWGGYTWPTFNLADSWIVVGVAILMIEIFFQEEPEEADPAPAGQGST